MLSLSSPESGLELSPKLNHKSSPESTPQSSPILNSYQSCPKLPFCVIDFLVEPDDGVDVVKAEVGEVGLGRVQRVPVVDPALRVRPAEGHELLGDEPVEIAVLKTGL